MFKRPSEASEVAGGTTLHTKGARSLKVAFFKSQAKIKYKGVFRKRKQPFMITPYGS